MTRALISLLLLFMPLVAMGQGQPIGPGPDPAGYRAESPRTAYAAGRFLTLWSEDRGGEGRRTFGSLSNARGYRLSQSPLSFPACDGSLLGTGETFVLFCGSTMFEIARDGTISRSVDLPFVPRDAVWDGTVFMAWVGPFHGYRFFDRNGTLVPRGIRFPATPWWNAVLFEDMLVSIEGLRLRFAREDGSVRVVTIPEADATWLHSSRLFREGDHVRVVWSVIEYSGGESSLLLKTGLLDATGLLLEHLVLGSYRLTTQVIAMALWREAGSTRLLLGNGRRTGARLELLTFDASAVASSVVIGPWAGSSAVASSDTLIVVATGAATEGRGGGLATRSIQRDGTTGPSQTLSDGPGWSGRPLIAEGNGRAMAVWAASDGGFALMHTAALDSRGNRIGGEDGGEVIAIDAISWNGEEFLIVLRDVSRVLAVRLDATGRSIGAEAIVLDTESAFAAAATWAGDRWAVVWIPGKDARFATISREGEVSDARDLPLVAPPPPEGVTVQANEAPALSYNGRVLLMAWVERSRPDDWIVPIVDNDRRTSYAMRLSSAGDPLDGVALALDGGWNVAVATSGAEFLVVTELMAHFLVAREDSLRIAVSRDLPLWADAAGVTWTGREYAVALTHRIGQAHRMGIWRLDSFGALDGEARGVKVAPPGESERFERPGIAAPFASNAVVVLNEVHLVEGTGPVVYREREMERLPPPPSAPRNVRADYPRETLIWDAPLLGTVDEYVVERWNPGYDGEPEGWEMVDWLPADARSTVLPCFDCRLIRVRAVNAGGRSEPGSIARLPKRRAVG